jgi:carbon storage regulator
LRVGVLDFRTYTKYLNFRKRQPIRIYAADKEIVMLVLTRKLGESIAIDDHIKIRVVQIKGKQVRLGIEAPKDTKIHREEVYVAIQDQNQQSLQVSSDNVKSVSKLLKPE